MDDTSTILTASVVADPSTPAPSADDVTWRELRPGLWAGRANGKPIGIIEHGRRYSFTGVDEQIHPGYRTLADAQDAATGPIQIILTPRNEIEPAPPSTPASARRRAASAIALIPAVAAAGAIVAGGIALAAQFLLT